MSDTPRFGLDPDDPRVATLAALYEERYGPLAQLERERARPPSWLLRRQREAR